MNRIGRGQGVSVIGFRCILLSGVAAVGFSSGVLAADVAPRAPVTTIAAPGFSWDGLYIGVHGGYASGSNDVTIGVATGDLSPRSGFGGVQFGYNYHLSPNWVLGYEIDLSFGNLDDSRLIGVNVTPLEINAFGTARTRLGYASGQWLLYVTAGMAWANTELDNVAGVSDFERPQIGYAAGAGLEYAFSHNWSVKAEYIYMDLGDTRSVIAGAPIDTDLAMHTVRVGLNYRFANWGRAATPAYFTKAPVRSAGWTGPYIGVHGGYGRGSFDTRAGAVSQSFDPQGGFGGFQAGYNWQFANNVVIGVESDSSWGSLKDSTGAANVDIDAMGTVRARLGYAFNNNVLLYGTGGLAWAHAESTTTAAVRDQFYLGWAAGAGVEYAFTSHWSAKLEYLYADFGDIRDFNGVPVTASLDVSTVKVGLNYRASVLELIGLR